MNKTLRKPIIAGNWKMNKTCSEATILLNEIIPLVKNATCEVVACVPFTDLAVALEATKGTNVKIGAENCSYEKAGAFTGEISADMLAEMNVSYVIIGHSERRAYFGETNETVNGRVKAALEAGLKVILCVGETLTQREQNITFETCAIQTKIALQGVTKADMKNITIAYEPVWAIGTGKTATEAQAQEVCLFIRDTIATIYNKDIANGVAVQYGGSMNALNASALLSESDIDGGLIGGASLKAADFNVIVQAASNG